MNIIVIDKKMPCPQVSRKNIDIAEPRLFYVEVKVEGTKILVNSDWTAVDNTSYAHYEDEPYYYEVDEQFHQTIHPMYWADFTDEVKEANSELFSLSSYKDTYPEWYSDILYLYEH